MSLSDGEWAEDRGNLQLRRATWVEFAWILPYVSVDREMGLKFLEFRFRQSIERCIYRVEVRVSAAGVVERFTRYPGVLIVCSLLHQSLLPRDCNIEMTI